MNISLMFLLLIPIFVIAVMKFLDKRNEFNWLEVVIALVVSCLIVYGAISFSKYSQVADTEILNGEVISKVRDEVSCSHSYSCNPHKVCDSSGKNCHTEYDTCYEHRHDYNWIVKSNIGNYEISRVDRQGLAQPYDFTNTFIGDPVAMKHSFVNYIKGVPHSIFHMKEEAINNFNVPEYPLNIVKYKNIDRVINMGTSLNPLIKGYLNAQVAEKLKAWGPQKEANIVFVFTNYEDRNFKYALENKWLGGKKNDIIVIFSITNETINWVDIVSWSKNELFKVELQEGLSKLKFTNDNDFVNNIFNVFSEQMPKFERMHMKDYEYLKDEVEVPMWLLFCVVITCFVASFGVCFVAKRIQE